MTDRGGKKTKRQEILDRLNSHDTGPHNGDRQNKGRSKKNETEREEALAKGRRGLGWVGGAGGF
ncbi:MAG: hypothetical protein WA990_11650 [Rubrobacteraceae bacterium]